jgi:hypothetical protein
LPTCKTEEANSILEGLGSLVVYYQAKTRRVTVNEIPWVFDSYDGQSVVARKILKRRDIRIDINFLRTANDGARIFARYSRIERGRVVCSDAIALSGTYSP